MRSAFHHSKHKQFPSNCYKYLSRFMHFNVNTLSSKGFLVCLLLIFFACKKDTDGSKKVLGNRDTVQQRVLKKSSKPDSVNPYWNVSENSTRGIDIVSPSEINDTFINEFSGKIGLADLDKNLVLSDYKTSTGTNSSLIEFEIYGYSPKVYRIKNILVPYPNGIDNYAKTREDEVIIPYFNDLELETSVLTRWIIYSDSLEFDGYFKNLMTSKYSRVLPKEVLRFEDSEYILGLTTHGEGGGYGEEYWLGKVVDKDLLNIKTICSTGYHFSDDTLRQISYTRENNLLTFYEGYYTNTNERFNEKDYLFKKKLTEVALD